MDTSRMSVDIFRHNNLMEVSGSDNDLDELVFETILPDDATSDGLRFAAAERVLIEKYGIRDGQVLAFAATISNF